MHRPRWHDVAIVLAMIAVVATGVWALWWDDVRGVLHLKPAVEPASGSATPSIDLPRT
jgi:hypothetical protein